MTPFSDKLAIAITTAVKQLLSEKHLYQSVRVDTSFKGMFSADHDAVVKKRIESAWFPENPQELGYDSSTSFKLPTIDTFCATCGSCQPFKPVHQMSFPTILDRSSRQVFHLAYQCQKCDGTPVTFLISRDFNKLTLCGRDPMCTVQIPQCLPKKVGKFYARAVVAHNSGETLAAVFLLRVFVEQFWLSVPEVKAAITGLPRQTGDELGNYYSKTLRSAIRDGFPSLSDVYGQLSSAMHGAVVKDGLFEDACAKIVKHFNARELYDVRFDEEETQVAG